jgi:ribose-phosphate pyrophosphokinase
MHVIGDVEGRNALIVDDIIDTAGTLTKTVEALKGKGVRRILSAGTHGVLSGPALSRINDSPLEAVLITNTIPVDKKLSQTAKLRPLSVAPLLGEAIKRIHENSSVSSLFV